MAGGLREFAEDERADGELDSAQMLEDDAGDAERIAELLEKGEFDKAQEAVSRLDTAARDRIGELWTYEYWQHERRMRQRLDVINSHRAARGAAPVDPERAGWTEGDILAELARIGREPNPLR